MSPTLIYTPLNNKVLELGLWKENKSSYQHHHHTLLKRIWCEWANWHSNFPSNATSSPLPRFSKFLYLLSSQITYQVTAQEGICILTKIKTLSEKVSLGGILEEWRMCLKPLQSHPRCDYFICLPGKLTLAGNHLYFSLIEVLFSWILQSKTENFDPEC